MSGHVGALSGWGGSMHNEGFVLRLSCKDQPGIVAAVATAIFEAGGNIIEAQQFEDRDQGEFFARIQFVHRDPDASVEMLSASFREPAARFGMEWTLRRASEKKRVLILASKSDHCLADLLYRWRTGEMGMEVVGVVSNHPIETYRRLRFDDVDFHHLPVTKETKAEQEAQIWTLVQEKKVDLVILARYMQILSNDLVQKLSGRCINIHHSFLPSFKGAQPYHQAHARGVKLIGATSHYVTADLDEGPIIEQDVEQVSHRDRPEDLVMKGRDVERRVLARAVRNHVADRVILHRHSTIVFPE